MGQILCWHIWCNCTDSIGTSPSFVTENTGHFLSLLSFCKNKDKIEIEALTTFSFTDPGFEKLFMNIKLWSISPWSIMQMCTCTAAALQHQGKYELSTSKKNRHMQATQGPQSRPRATSTSRGGVFYAHSGTLWENGNSDSHRVQVVWPGWDFCITSVLVRVVLRQCHVRL